MAHDRAARAEHGFHERDRHAACKNVEGEPHHDLVGAEGDDEQGKDQRENEGRRDPAEDAAPGRACPDRAQHREEGASQHLAFQADVEDAGFGGEGAAKRHHQDRRRGAEHGDDQRDVEKARQNFHRRSPACASPRRRRRTCAETLRMMKAWITVMISREAFVSVSSRSEPERSAPKKRAVKIVPMGEPLASSAAEVPCRCEGQHQPDHETPVEAREAEQFRQIGGW